MGADAPNGTPMESQPAEESSTEPALDNCRADNSPDAPKVNGNSPTTESSPRPNPAGALETDTSQEASNNPSPFWGRVYAPLMLRLNVLLEPLLRRLWRVHAARIEHRLNMRNNPQLAEEDVRYEARRDPATNAATRLPAGEQALMPVIWLAEVFTPTTIDNLAKGLRELAAKTDDASDHTIGDLCGWVLSSRRLGRFAYRKPIFINPLWLKWNVGVG
jgi:hypothetical protein